MTPDALIALAVLAVGLACALWAGPRCVREARARNAREDDAAECADWCNVRRLGAGKP